MQKSVTIITRLTELDLPFVWFTAYAGWKKCGDEKTRESEISEQWKPLKVLSFDYHRPRSGTPSFSGEVTPVQSSANDLWQFIVSRRDRVATPRCHYANMTSHFLRGTWRGGVAPLVDGRSHW